MNAAISGFIVCAQLAEAILDLEHVLAPDVLHGDEVRVVDAAELEDLADVGVVQLAADLGLIDEHLDEVGVLRHRRQDALDGEDLLEALDAEGLGLEDLGHAANADALEQDVLAEWDRLPQLGLAPSAHECEQLIVSPHVMTHQAKSWARSHGRRAAIEYLRTAFDGSDQ